MTPGKYENTLNKEESILDSIVGSISSLKSGSILIELENKPTIDITATKTNEVNKIAVDILNPEVFGIFRNVELKNNETFNDSIKNEHKDSSVDKIKDKLDIAKDFFHLFTDAEANIFDQLKVAKDFAEKLSDNNITLVLMRKGKEAIIMGKDANPSLSKIISGSDDLQIKSVTESSKLVGEISTTLVDDDEEEGKKKNIRL